MLTESYSTLYHAILNVSDRQRIGRQLARLIQIHFGSITKTMRVLDVGAAGGVITQVIAPLFKHVTAIDSDSKAITFAAQHSSASNITYAQADALRLPYKNGQFDFVVCNQVYEFVGDDVRLLREIRRVLKPKGWCLLGAANKLTFFEQQYHLPLLHWLPPSLASFLVRLSKRGTGYTGRYRTYWGLRQMVKGFRIVNYSPRIIQDPHYYGFQKLVRFARITRFIPHSWWTALNPLLPNYLWMLQKNS